MLAPFFLRFAELSTKRGLLYNISRQNFRLTFVTFLSEHPVVQVLNNARLQSVLNIEVPLILLTASIAPFLWLNVVFSSFEREREFPSFENPTPSF